MYTIGFDKEKYLEIQSKKIIERVNKFEKLYLEFGGKIFDDMHGSRVLPGFEPNMKINLLQTLADKTEIILVINSSDIEQNRMQSDYGISYDEHLLNLIDKLKNNDLYVSSVVITQYRGQNLVTRLRRRLAKLELDVYTHYIIPDYPTNLKLIMSEDGFGKNEYVHTTRPLVVVAAPGSGSGKMATCMSQLYHDFNNGIKAGYAKFEKFPVWNLSPHHPINLAYEAATTNIQDKNMIDPFHLEAYGITAVNYNRDIEAFPVLNAMFKKIWGQSPYKSPTDMGVNMIKDCITNEEVCIKASEQEIIRRYYKLLCNDFLFGDMKNEIDKIKSLMNMAGITEKDRKVAGVATEKSKSVKSHAMAIELSDGTILSGKTTSLLSAAGAVILNSLKCLANIRDEVDIISPNLIEPIQELNRLMGMEHPLEPEEILIALSISTATNPSSKLALQQLQKLKHSEAHSTTLLESRTLAIFQKLGINVTCEVPLVKVKA